MCIFMVHNPPVARWFKLASPRGYLITSIRPRQHIRRNRQTVLLGSFEVDDQLELFGCSTGRFGWLRALEDLIHVGGGAPLYVSEACSIEHEAASIHKFHVCTSLATGSWPKDPQFVLLTNEHRVRRHHERRGSLAVYGRESLLNSLDRGHSGLQLLSQCLGRNLMPFNDSPFRILWIRDTATRVTLGTASLSTSRRFPPNSAGSGSHP